MILMPAGPGGGWDGTLSPAGHDGPARGGHVLACCRHVDVTADEKPGPRERRTRPGARLLPGRIATQVFK
jgi:hypothetical protein